MTSSLLTVIFLTLVLSIAAVHVYQRRTRRIMRKMIRDIGRETWAAAALNNGCLMPGLPLPSASDARIPAELLAYLVRYIKDKKPKVIVELGSGLSTIVIGLALKNIGCGRLISVEHHADYFEETQHFIELYGIDAQIQLIHAPLVATDNGLWYEPSWVDGIKDIELMLVDGPPGATGRRARYPALPVLWSSLNSNALIILDDGERKDETEIAALWQQQYPELTAQRLPFIHEPIAFRTKPQNQSALPTNRRSLRS